MSVVLSMLCLYMFMCKCNKLHFSCLCCTDGGKGVDVCVIYGPIVACALARGGVCVYNRLPCLSVSRLQALLCGSVAKAYAQLSVRQQQTMRW